VTELSPEEHDALLQLATGDDFGVFDARTLRDLRTRGLATFSDDGWELTDLGERTVDRRVEI
jgi:hypothetical protein